MKPSVSRPRAPLIAIRSIHAAGAFVATAGLLSLLAPAAHANPPVVSGNGWTADVIANPAFNDDFNGTQPDGTGVDTTKWNYRTDQYKSQLNSVQTPANVSVANGNMIVSLLKQDTPNVVGPNGTIITQHYTGGGLISKQRFRYGYYETSIKINSTPGWHSSFWLQEGDGSNTFTTDRRTEIDVFEINSASLTKIQHNLFKWYPPFTGSGAGELTTNPYVYSGFATGQNFSTAYHTYGVDWEENSITFYIDGVAVTKSPAPIAYPPSADTHDPVSIWLTDVASGSTLPTASADQIYFDYVRYWQKDYYVDYNDAGSGYAEPVGTWYTSSLAGWTKDYKTRYATCNVGGNVATWTPKIQNAGNYDVYYYNIVNANSDSNMALAVAGQTTMVNGTTGTTGWVKVTAAPIAVPAGTGTTVSMTSSGSGCARAENVKFVRVN
ncbi:family 16 glycosylhydrolase [Paraburkholderia dipogonis]|uniref:family 16 glycosylhydrolase n=1 Tax=Paraburkholderia dipogonis TaxID=1211383 RepID=UPI0038B95739